MRLSKVFLITVFISVLCIPHAATAEKGSYKTTVEAQGVAVEGKIFFSDYYSMGGEKCAAFLEAEDGGLYCILDTMKSNNLKNEMGLASGRVKVTGKMMEDESGTYLQVEGYDVKEQEGRDEQDKYRAIE
jgi:hypothetical protein